MTVLSGPQIVLIGMTAIFVVLAFMMLLVVCLRLIFGQKAALEGDDGKIRLDLSEEFDLSHDSETGAFTNTDELDDSTLAILTAAVRAYMADEAKNREVCAAVGSRPSAWQQAGLMRRMQGKGRIRPNRFRDKGLLNRNGF